jgi:hypothetical protein
MSLYRVKINVFLILSQGRFSTSRRLILLFLRSFCAEYDSSYTKMNREMFGYKWAHKHSQ